MIGSFFKLSVETFPELKKFAILLKNVGAIGELSFLFSVLLVFPVGLVVVSPLFVFEVFGNSKGKNLE